MSDQYTTGANDFSGTHATHPDLPVGATTAVDVAGTYGVSDMAAVHASMLANSVHSVDLLKNSDMVLVRTGNGSGTNASGGYLLVYWRDFPLQKLFQNYVFREEFISGECKLRAVSRTSSRVEGLESALTSVGYNVGTGSTLLDDSWTDAAAITAKNQALYSKKIYLTLHKLSGSSGSGY